MALFKFCYPEHNINNGSNLKLGTLYSYRKIEDPELRDEDEGKFTFELNFPEEITLDRKWINLLFQRNVAFGRTDDVPIFPGGFSVRMDYMHMMHMSEEDVTFKSARFTVSQNVNDCFIFCMSKLDDVSKKKFQNYPDHWSIPGEQADEFSSRLMRLVFSQIETSFFEEPFGRNYKNCVENGLSMSVKHRQVQYGPRSLTITPKNKPSFDDLIKTLTDVAFIKPESFSPEKEYRFLFQIRDFSGIYTPAVDAIYIKPFNLLNFKEALDQRQLAV